MLDGDPSFFMQENLRCGFPVQIVTGIAKWLFVILCGGMVRKQREGPFRAIVHRLK